jgi:hypothetical protein
VIGPRRRLNHFEPARLYRRLQYLRRWSRRESRGALFIARPDRQKWLKRAGTDAHFAAPCKPSVIEHLQQVGDRDTQQACCLLPATTSWTELGD